MFYDKDVSSPKTFVSHLYKLRYLFSSVRTES